jgi:hypothetical protein
MFMSDPFEFGNAAMRDPPPAEIRQPIAAPKSADPRPEEFQGIRFEDRSGDLIAA